MELFESHFNNLPGNLYYDEITNTYEMFKGIGKSNHLNYLTFKKLFENIVNIKEPIILESGISCYGTHSTHLFNEYIRKYGGRFWSVDIRPELVESVRGNMCPGTQLVCDDSVKFFNNWVQISKDYNITPDVIYLDSFDLDYYNYIPSAEHGLKEYKALTSTFRKNTLLLIDDTPSTPYWLDTRDTLYDDMSAFYAINNFLPGKGMLVLNEPKKADLLLHNYQLLYKFL